jgi:hypothetical protein
VAKNNKSMHTAWGVRVSTRLKAASQWENAPRSKYEDIELHEKPAVNAYE